MKDYAITSLIVSALCLSALNGCESEKAKNYREWWRRTDRIHKAMDEMNGGVCVCRSGADGPCAVICEEYEDTINATKGMQP